MESRSDSCRGRQFIARTPLVAGLAIVFLFGAGCGSRPDDVTRQFYERLVALDVAGMSEFVCKPERPTFRNALIFVESAPSIRGLGLEAFRTETERSDGNSVVLNVSGRFVSDEFRAAPLSSRVRLVRDGGEWCITGQRDGFRSIQESAEEMLFRAAMASGVVVASFGGFDETSEPPQAPSPIQGEGVTTASGLTYVEVETGSGAMPQPGQTVRVHYTMWLKASGEQIDTSLGGEPFDFVVGGGEVVSGFDEGISTMREGGRRRLTVPPKLGYGDDDDYGDIPPNSTLIFDVELVDAR
jgi:FKBP-type peptidyl-prolyl cis-trans isomerase